MEQKTFKVGRDAKTGRFITVKEAQGRKSTAIVETIKIKNLRNNQYWQFADAFSRYLNDSSVTTSQAAL